MHQLLKAAQEVIDSADNLSWTDRDQVVVSKKAYDRLADVISIAQRQQASVRTLYTVGGPDGARHGSNYLDKTICGQKISESWKVVDSSFKGAIDCPECLARAGRK